MSEMRSLLLGIFLLVLAGVGGLVYRNALERPSKPSACTLDARVCPDGTALGRTGPSCTFPVCPPPNVALETANIAYVAPAGFSEGEKVDVATVAAYEAVSASIIIRRYVITASSTALATIQSTAIGGATGEPLPVTAFTSTVLGTHRFTVASIERFEGVIVTAYYLARGADVLRFDAVDREVRDWTSPSLDVSALPAHAAVRALLGTLQGQ